jgi:hypothetical protein
MLRTSKDRLKGRPARVWECYLKWPDRRRKQLCDLSVTWGGERVMNKYVNETIVGIFCNVRVNRYIASE